MAATPSPPILPPSPLTPGATPPTTAASPQLAVSLAVAQVRIAQGGWTIKATCTAPPGAKVYFQIGDKAEHRLDITAGYGSTNLDDLLAVIALADTWGTTVKVRAVVVGSDGTTLGQSAAQDFACPVKPYDGKLTFDAIGAATPAFTYPGNGFGRIFKPRKDGKYYFELSGKFETDNKMRGFDCTTFPMALFQNFPNMAGAYGTKIVEALGAVKCEMEQKKEKDVREFFADATKGGTGLYIMWSAGHVLLVKDAMIHEFTFGGYKKTSAATRALTAPQGLWWIRKLPATLAP